MGDHKDALDLFGEILVKRVRDETIDLWEVKLQGKMKDEESLQIFKELDSFSSQQVCMISDLIPKIVDTALHHFLWTLEEEESLTVLMATEEDDAIDIKEASDGLPGELYTEDGWISRYSSK